MVTVRGLVRLRWEVFPPLVWVVLIGTLLTRGAFFMVWPFLAIILEREFDLSASQIGSILGSAFLASALIGLYAGNLSDRFGRQPVMLAGCAGAVAAYVALATGSTVAAYSVGAFLAGLSRSILEAPGKAIIADCIDNQSRRDVAFHVRYFLINVGAAIGPLLGLAFGLSARQPTFWITAGAYACFALVVIVAFQYAPEAPHEAGRNAVTMRGAVAILRADRQFLLMLAAMTLSMFAYAQQESTLIQHISVEGGDLAVTLVTALLVTNAVTIVLFQFPLLRVLAGYDPYVRSYIGITLFIAAFAAYAMLPVAALLPWIATTWVLSVGEAILFPTLQLQVDRMAPPDMKGSYFGAAGLSALGFGVGPFIGGFLLEHVGGTATFWLTAASAALCGVFYWLASRQRVAHQPRTAAL